MRRQYQLWEERWKQFLYEGLTDKVLSYRGVNKLFGHIHLSSQFLDEPTFEFEPRLPRHPWQDQYGSVIEDDFTPRISTAPTIEKAAEALEADNPTDFYVYVSDFIPRSGDEPVATQAKVSGCPGTEANRYGPNFEMQDWINYQVEIGALGNDEAESLKFGRKAPSRLPPDLMDDFEECVPDADKTQEAWILQPTKMFYLGKATEGKVRLSSGAVAFFRHHLPLIKKQLRG